MLRVLRVELRVWGLEFRDSGLGFRVQGSGLRVEGRGFIRIEQLVTLVHELRAVRKERPVVHGRGERAGAAEGDVRRGLCDGAQRHGHTRRQQHAGDANRTRGAGGGGVGAQHEVRVEGARRVFVVAVAHRRRVGLVKNREFTMPSTQEMEEED